MAKVKAVAKELPRLSDAGIRLGSMYLAASNLGLNVEHCKGSEDVRRVYGEADQGCAEGTGDIEGPGAEPERKMWEKELRSRAKRVFWLSEFQKEIPWIFEVQS